MRAKTRNLKGKLGGVDSEEGRGFGREDSGYQENHKVRAGKRRRLSARIVRGLPTEEKKTHKRAITPSHCPRRLGRESLMDNE